MFERFTDRARRVVVLAQEEARELGHNYIGTEHILLGLIREREGVAARALEALGISLDAVRQQVQEVIGTGTGMPAGHIPFTPRAKKVLELSLREALQLGHNYIGTEHILLGLVREGEGVAAQVLVALGADLNRVRQQVIQLLHGTATGTAGEPGEEPAEAARRTVIGQPAMRAQGARSARLVPQGQLDSITARLDEMVSRLGLIAERLTSIENLLAGGGRPVTRAPHRPPAPGRPPAARRPKPPPAPPPTDAPPPTGEPPAAAGPGDGTPAAEAPAAQPPPDEPPESGARQG